MISNRHNACVIPTASYITVPSQATRISDEVAGIGSSGPSEAL